MIADEQALEAAPLLLGTAESIPLLFEDARLHEPLSSPDPLEVLVARTELGSAVREVTSRRFP